MKQRSPIAVLLLGLITGGIYSLYWLVKTKGEMNQLGAKIPTAWILLIPIVGQIWWLWEYSEGVGHVTNEKISGVLAFVLLFLLGTIGQAIIQDSFNKIVAVPSTMASEPTQPMTTSQPVVNPTDTTPTMTPPTPPFGPTSAV